MYARTVAVLLLGCGLVACASTPAKRAKRMRTQLEEMAQKEAGYQRRIEELSNRIALLEERSETSESVQSTLPRRLPVVRIRPGQPAREFVDGQPVSEAQGAGPAQTPAETGAEVDSPDAPGKQRQPSALVASSEVDYHGAARRDGPRPVLKLHEARRANRFADADLPASDTKVGEWAARLPVAPLPETLEGDDRLKVYRQAMTAYRAGEYREAARLFKNFAQQNRRHDYADNAIYWLGECYYDLKRYRTALQTFRKVVVQHPQGNKAPDALLKMGYCYVKLKEKKSAKTVLARLVTRFPHSRLARLANATLLELR